MLTDIDKMWIKFKELVVQKTEESVPKVNRFHTVNTWKKKLWKRPLSGPIRQNVRKNIGHGIDTLKEKIRLSTANIEEYVPSNHLRDKHCSVYNRTTPAELLTSTDRDPGTI